MSTPSAQAAHGACFAEIHVLLAAFQHRALMGRAVLVLKGHLVQLQTLPDRRTEWPACPLRLLLLMLASVGNHQTDDAPLLSSACA